MRISVDSRSPLIERDLRAMIGRIFRSSHVGCVKVCVQTSDVFRCSGSYVWPDNLRITGRMCQEEQEAIHRMRWARTPDIEIVLYLPLPTPLEVLVLRNDVARTDKLIERLCVIANVKPNARVMASRLRWDLSKFQAIQ